ncbi:MAG: acyl-ACP--UDP-N-acetylglucosamine O-acyltransferase [Gemmatimonadota bacterium]
MRTVDLELEPGLRHPSAVVHPEARIAESASIGPYAVIGPNVEIAEEVRVGPHVYIERDTSIGRGCTLAKGAVLGTDPQDMKYRGEDTVLEVGERTVIREYATLNRGTAASGRTVVGDDCLIMAYAHVAHDCRLGDHVILANSVHMGGHVEIGEWASVGGVTAIHQFVRIGCHSFIGGGSRLPQDVVPYVMVSGNPCAAHGLNTVGLRRRGFPAATLRKLRNAYRVIFQSHLNIGQACEALEAEGMESPEIRRMLTFIQDSRRGITT